MSEVVCRLCSSNENLIWVFDERLERDMADVIKITCGVTIKKSDVISQKVCSSCCQITIKMFKLRLKSAKNNEYLTEKLLQKHQVESEISSLVSLKNVTNNNVHLPICQTQPNKTVPEKPQESKNIYTPSSKSPKNNEYLTEELSGRNQTKSEAALPVLDSSIEIQPDKAVSESPISKNARWLRKVGYTDNEIEKMKELILQNTENNSGRKLRRVRVLEMFTPKQMDIVQNGEVIEPERFSNISDIPFNQKSDRVSCAETNTQNVRRARSVKTNTRRTLRPRSNVRPVTYNEDLSFLQSINEMNKGSSRDSNFSTSPSTILREANSGTDLLPLLSTSKM